MRFPTRTAGRGLAAAALAVALLAGPLGTAPATASPSAEGPALTLTGTGTWKTPAWLPVAVVAGSGWIDGDRLPATPVLVAAAVQADDRTLPGPGECEHAIATMAAHRPGKVVVTLVGDGQVCGHWVQPGISNVTHVFTGGYEVLGDHTRPARLQGTDGWFEVRLAQDGRAGVTAFDS